MRTELRGKDEFSRSTDSEKKTLKRKRRWNKKKTGRRRPPHTQEQLSADRLSDWAYVKNLRREWEIVVYSPLPYPELQRDYRFNVKLAGSLIASPIGIKVHTVSPPKRGVAISHHSTGVSCQSCLNFSMARDLATTMPAAKWTETVESAKKKNYY